ncbi:Uncharacterized protein SAMN04487926_15325 [Paraburkholderia steynii]|uniref:Photosynthesis system II assembly factor Ycf48/Hcf136-like domain-containing protein n=1 Tax=Paraburkholderia steynii TaxID=1245441 RepID=A0A7Z7BKR8_9BURK|nr:YCF48-related protein [Paraburkholderia steynii]SDJ47305.1 Uncharacterized protein SAMN04487926_15325 [Paraburkholderia steynii]
MTTSRRLNNCSVNWRTNLSRSFLLAFGLVSVYTIVVLLMTTQTPANIALIETFPGSANNPVRSPLAEEIRTGKCGSFSVVDQPYDRAYVAADDLHAWIFSRDKIYAIQKVGGNCEQHVFSLDTKELELVRQAQFLSDSHRGWLVGDGGLIATTYDGGRSWIRQLQTEVHDLHSLYFLKDGMRGWAAGGGIITSTSDGGATWQVQARRTEELLMAIEFLEDGLHGWAAGSEGTILATTDGGRNWEERDSTVAKSMLRWIHFSPDGLHGWAGGDRGVIVATSDGGRKWKSESFSDKFAWDAAFIAPKRKEIWVMGSSVATSHGDGKDWTLVYQRPNLAETFRSAGALGLFGTAFLFLLAQLNKQTGTAIATTGKNTPLLDEEQTDKVPTKRESRNRLRLVRNRFRNYSRCAWPTLTAWARIFFESALISLLSLVVLSLTLLGTQEGREVLLGVSGATMVAPTDEALPLLTLLFIFFGFGIGLAHSSHVLLMTGAQVCEARIYRIISLLRVRAKPAIVTENHRTNRVPTTTPTVNQSKALYSASVSAARLATPQIVGTIAVAVSIFNLLCAATVASPAHDIIRDVPVYHGLSDSQFHGVGVRAFLAILSPIVITWLYGRKASGYIKKTVLFFVCIGLASFFLDDGSLPVGNAVNRSFHGSFLGFLLSHWFNVNAESQLTIGNSLIRIDFSFGVGIVCCITLLSLVFAAFCEATLKRFGNKAVFYGAIRLRSCKNLVAYWIICVVTFTCAAPTVALTFGPLFVARIISNLPYSSFGVPSNPDDQEVLGILRRNVLDALSLIIVATSILWVLNHLSVSIQQFLGPGIIFILVLLAMVWLCTGIHVLIKIFFYGAAVPVYTVAAAILLFAYWSDEHVGREMLNDSATVPQLRTGATLPPAEKQDVILNAHGGGIRAAYFTAAFLAKMDDVTCGGFGQRIKVFSGVSGGSLGIGVYLTLRQALISSGGWQSCTPMGAYVDARGPLETMVQNALLQDYLSSTLTTLLTRDIFRVTALSLRGQSLLDSWQKSVKESMLKGAATVNASGVMSPGFELPLHQLTGGITPGPIVLFNSSDSKSGTRVVFSSRSIKTNIPSDGTIWVDSDNTIQVGQAILHSSRFPIISPAGEFRDMKLVDGGYIDNSGAETLAQVVPRDSGGLWLDIDGNPKNLYETTTSSIFSGVEALLAAHEGQSSSSVRRMCDSHKYIRRLSVSIDEDRLVAEINILNEGMLNRTKRNAVYNDQHIFYAPAMGWYLSRLSEEALQILLIVAVIDALRLDKTVRDRTAVEEICY